MLMVEGSQHQKKRAVRERSRRVTLSPAECKDLTALGGDRCLAAFVCEDHLAAEGNDENGSRDVVLSQFLALMQSCQDDSQLLRFDRS